NRPREEFLAGPSLAKQQHSSIATGKKRDLSDLRKKARGLSHQKLHSHLGPEGVCEAVSPLRSFQKLKQARRSSRNIYRKNDEVRSAESHQVEQLMRVTPLGYDNDFRTVMAGFESRYKPAYNVELSPAKDEKHCIRF